MHVRPLLLRPFLVLLLYCLQISSSSLSSKHKRSTSLADEEIELTRLFGYVLPNDCLMGRRRPSSVEPALSHTKWHRPNALSSINAFPLSPALGHTHTLATLLHESFCGTSYG